MNRVRRSYVGALLRHGVSTRGAAAVIETVVAVCFITVLDQQVQVQGPSSLLPAAGWGGVRCTNIFRPLHAEDVGAASHHTYSVAFRLRAVGTRGRFPQSHAVSPAETRSEYTSSMRAGRVKIHTVAGCQTASIASRLARPGPRQSYMITSLRMPSASVSHAPYALFPTTRRTQQASQVIDLYTVQRQ